MSDVTRRALRVYAALGELRGTGDDVPDALIPFFEPVLEVMNGTIFDPKLFASGVRRLYRWRFTTDVASSFIPRLSRLGYINRKASLNGDVVYIVTFQPRLISSLPPIGPVVDQIIDEFERFPQRVSDLLSYKKTREELTDILIRFLISMESNRTGPVHPSLGDLEPSGSAGDVLAGLPEGRHPLDSNDRYICARFIRHIVRRRPAFTEHLARLSSIALLAEVVEDFLKPTQALDKSDLTIALDAPLALDYLGCSGREIKGDISAVVDSLRRIGCNFIVFPVTCEEMSRNLQSLLSLNPSERYGYTQNAILKREIGLDVVRAVANNPERALSAAGVTVRQITIDGLPSSHVHFSKDQHLDFLSSIEWGQSIVAREHDALCATYVMRLRGGNQSSDLFKTKFVLATRNGSFVRQSRRYCLESRMISAHQEGAAVHQRELATAAWLRTGLGAETIPLGHLIASCDRVLSIKPEVRKALQVELSKLTSDRVEQFKLLMLDSRSVQKLADQTFNNENAITAENAEELLNVMRLATVEKERASFAAQLEEQKVSAIRRVEAVEAENNAKDLLLSSYEDDLTASQRRVEVQVNSLAQAVNREAFIVEVVFTLFLLLLGSLGGLNALHPVLNGWVMSGIALISGGFGFYRLVMAALERPAPAFNSVLTPLVRTRWLHRLQALHLADVAYSRNFTCVKGRVVSGQNVTAAPAAASSSHPGPASRA